MGSTRKLCGIGKLNIKNELINSLLQLFSFYRECIEKIPLFMRIRSDINLK